MGVLTSDQVTPTSKQTVECQGIARQAARRWRVPPSRRTRCRAETQHPPAPRSCRPADRDLSETSRGVKDTQPLPAVTAKVPVVEGVAPAGPCPLWPVAAP